MVTFYGQVHGRNWGTRHQPVIGDGVKKCGQCQTLKPLYKYYWEHEYHATCVDCKRSRERASNIRLRG